MLNPVAEAAVMYNHAEMTTDELVARLYWLNNEAPLDDPKYDDEYWDIVFTLTMRGDICENA